MTIAAADVYRYRLPLTAPLATGGTPRSDRTGLLLRLAAGDEAVGWGEAAPLPGFSAESRAEAEAALLHAAEALNGAELASAPLDAVDERLAPDAPPSVRWAVEGAALACAAAARGRSVPALPGGGADTVALNALVTNEVDALEREGERLRRRGYRAVKLKVGRRAVARDAERVRALRRGLGAAPSLRLDANRAWSLDRALAFAGALGPECAPEYIEEPLRDPTQLPTFAEQSGLPVALDETTRERGPSVLSALAPIAAVVLKPTLIGGATATRSWAEAARDVGATPVVSASYESGVGLRLLVVLAAALSDAPAGLSTYARLAADTLTPRLALDGPTVDVAATGESRVHPDRITRITDSESA